MTGDWAGASIIGRWHRSRGMPNQDAWRGWRTARGTGVVVSDGVGSKPAAYESAKAACFVVPHTLRLQCFESLSPQDLTTAIESAWRLRLGNFLPQEIGATCLFSWAYQDEAVVLCQLGDGVVIYESQGEVFRLGTERTGWLNETDGLGIGGSWSVAMVANPTVILLATDGVGDDIASGGDEELVRLVQEELNPVDRKTASRRIRQGLQQWPNPATRDDMTLAVHWP